MMSNLVPSALMKVLMLSALALAAVLAGGCSSRPKMGQYDIQVSLDPTLASSAAVPSIEVDLVGVSPTGQAVWDAQSMNAYWAAANPERQTADRYTMTFGAGDTSPETLESDDPIWKRWAGEEYVYVLANLPGVSTDAAGSADSRRLMIPLDTRHWDRGQPIQVEVQRNRLVLRTPQKPIEAN
jgi:outer membrane murein-binding lipoprotein Lpp